MTIYFQAYSYMVIRIVSQLFHTFGIASDRNTKIRKFTNVRMRNIYSTLQDKTSTNFACGQLNSNSLLSWEILNRGLCLTVFAGVDGIESLLLKSRM